MSYPQPTAGTCFQAPFGPLWVATSPGGLVRVAIGARGPTHSSPAQASPGAEAMLRAALEELSAYFNTPHHQFTVPVDWAALGLTPFRRRVLQEAYLIPWGCVVTYGALARAIGNPRAARAVGRALAANPVPIVIPCHRVVATTGALHGYSAGLHVKDFLLRHEGVLT
ncbi:MAG: methylated-DNA--[protein]-cysteine S-methyltransferase [Ardenticatenia bacterium]|nr:methylated-DNA--[protein]-cysteine S-methyltransferase [Ardenticatenia bacterium]